eukprot:TRINITY_DN5913_c0_g1_i1.p1 TRINITY_DN5913_c0_g1~~TRINITY_DN5913_c0_g1_i1.p1  ORF type:complete len:584 (+),score=88.58 TRINITY_DN5913_c0_g1_i1:71-1753(+)
MRPPPQASLCPPGPPHGAAQPDGAGPPDGAAALRRDPSGRLRCRWEEAAPPVPPERVPPSGRVPPCDLPAWLAAQGSSRRPSALHLAAVPQPAEEPGAEAAQPAPAEELTAEPPQCTPPSAAAPPTTPRRLRTLSPDLSRPQREPPRGAAAPETGAAGPAGAGGSPAGGPRRAAGLGWRCDAATQTAGGDRPPAGDGQAVEEGLCEPLELLLAHYPRFAAAGRPLQRAAGPSAPAEAAGPPAGTRPRRQKSQAALRTAAAAAAAAVSPSPPAAGAPAAPQGATQGEGADPAGGIAGMHVTLPPGVDEDSEDESESPATGRLAAAAGGPGPTAWDLFVAYRGGAAASTAQTPPPRTPPRQQQPPRVRPRPARSPTAPGKPTGGPQPTTPPGPAAGAVGREDTAAPVMCGVWADGSGGAFTIPGPAEDASERWDVTFELREGGPARAPARERLRIVAAEWEEATTGKRRRLPPGAASRLALRDRPSAPRSAAASGSAPSWPWTPEGTTCALSIVSPRRRGGEATLGRKWPSASRRATGCERRAAPCGGPPRQPRGRRRPRSL